MTDVRSAWPDHPDYRIDLVPCRGRARVSVHGAVLAERIAFRDHHAYMQRDVSRLQAVARKRAAGGFATTEKDAINLGPNAARLAPLVAIPVTMELDTPADAVDTMLRIVSERRQRP